jgi:kynurenine formamidase
VRPDAPLGSSWGVWGDADQLGTLNLLTDERTRQAAGLVRRGSVFPLNLPLVLRPGIGHREPPRHHLLEIVAGELREAEGGSDGEGPDFRDDYLDGLWLQGSSQWDALTHARHKEFGNYNGVPDSEIHPGEGSKLGVDQWSKRAIVGRGVLLDVKRFLEERGRPYDVTSAHQFTVEDLQETAAAQGVSIEIGDILLFHTGYTKHFVDATETERARLLEWETLRAPGLENTLEMVEYLWDLHIAAVGSDTPGVEAMEIGPDFEFVLHPNLLPLLGMPMGEFWALDELAADCARDGQYDFLFVSVPLNVPGGVGSPPQAVAIK